MSKYYIGFSTVGESRTRNWVHYDANLVRRDLLNHFHTRVGERVMRSDWGCRIWNWLFDPYTDDLRDRITAEVIRICESDSRVSVTEVVVRNAPHQISVSVGLFYRGMEQRDSFIIDFERREEARIAPNF